MNFVEQLNSIMAINLFSTSQCSRVITRSIAVQVFVGHVSLISNVAAQEVARPDDPMEKAVRRINGPRTTGYDPEIDQACQVLESNSTKQEPEGEVLMALSKCQVHAGRLDRAAQLCARAKHFESRRSVKLSSRPKTGASNDTAQSLSTPDAYFEKCRTNLEGITDAVPKQVRIACANAASSDIHIERDQKELLRPKPNSVVYLYQGNYEVTCTSADGSKVRQHIDLSDKFTQLTITLENDLETGTNLPPITELRVAPAQPMVLESPWTQRKTAYVLGGAGALTLGVGVALHLQVPSIVDQMANEPDDSRYNQLRNRAMDYQLAAVSLEIAGGLLGVASAFCYFRIWPFGRTKSTGINNTVTIQPVLSQKGAYLFGKF
jgi:hypothetical protein